MIASQRSCGRAPALALLFLGLTVTSVHSAPGDLDATYGVGGLGTPIESSENVQSAHIAHASGKTVVVTSRNSPLDVVVARYDDTGALDPTWGGTGEVFTSVSSGFDEAVGVALQPDGKVVAAVSAGSLFILRYDAMGSLDPTWGTGGVVATPLTLASGGVFFTGHIVRIQPDGRILVAGRLGSSFALARYSSTGVLDTTFGGTGVATPVSGTGFRSIALQPDGKIVGVGGDSGVSVLRLLPAGTLDLAFGSGGVFAAPNMGSSDGDDPRDVTVQADGKVLVAFNDGLTSSLSPTGVGVFRLLASGTLDPTWGGTGVVVIPLTTVAALANIHVVLEQGDGRVVAAGGSSNSSALFPIDVATWRYLPDGSLDPSWGTGGISLTDLGSLIDYTTDAVLQPDGKLLVPGFVLGGPLAVIPLRFEAGEYCGDGVVQAGEDCDDGNPLDGDCCSSSCSIEPAGSVCIDDGLACTSDLCDASGTCVHDGLPNGSPCEDGNPCTTGETCAAGVCGGGTPGSGGTCQNPFVCYKSSPARGYPRFGGAPGLSLVDDLESGSFDAKSPFEICVPADVNDLGVEDSESRQVAYKLKKSRGEPKHVKQVGILVEDPLGVHSLDTKKPELLLAPAGLNLFGPASLPDPVTQNHYKCYKVKQSKGTPRFKQVKVTAADEFEDRFYDVYGPRRLCFAVDKDGEGVVNPGDLLTCYRLRRADGQPLHERLSDVRTADSLGTLHLATKTERDLCMPAALVP